MNDRFKFRVWSEEDCGYMESIDIFRLTHSGKLVFNNDSLNREPECNPKRYICEQCTGLKDKNSRLIYEGDIVKDDEGFVGLIKYDEVCAMFKIEFVYSAPSNFEDDMSWELEVIGNIHENHELME